MRLTSIVFSIFIVLGIAIAQEKTVSIPESQLTEQQKAALKLQQVDTTVEKAHGWVGISKELGQAFDSALSSLTIRSNEFAGTKVGKFTMFIVAWKVMGDEAAEFLNVCVHILGGFIELIIFLPLLVWSYRRTSLDRRVCITNEGFFLWPKKTYEVIKIDVKSDDATLPRWIHWAAFVALTLVWLFTMFSY